MMKCENCKHTALMLVKELFRSEVFFVNKEGTKLEQPVLMPDLEDEIVVEKTGEVKKGNTVFEPIEIGCRMYLECPQCGERYLPVFERNNDRTVSIKQGELVLKGLPE